MQSIIEQVRIAKEEYEVYNRRLKELIEEIKVDRAKWSFSADDDKIRYAMSLLKCRLIQRFYIDDHCNMAKDWDTKKFLNYYRVYDTYLPNKDVAGWMCEKKHLFTTLEHENILSKMWLFDCKHKKYEESFATWKVTYKAHIADKFDEYLEKSKKQEYLSVISCPQLKIKNIYIYGKL